LVVLLEPDELAAVADEDARRAAADGPSTV
jgi:hypothetical protein